MTFWFMANNAETAPSGVRDQRVESLGILQIAQSFELLGFEHPAPRH